MVMVADEHFVSPRVDRDRDQDGGSGGFPGLDQPSFYGRPEAWW